MFSETDWLSLVSLLGEGSGLFLEKADMQIGIAAFSQGHTYWARQGIGIFLGTYWKAQGIFTLEAWPRQRVEFGYFREKERGSFYTMYTVFLPSKWLLVIAQDPDQTGGFRLRCSRRPNLDSTCTWLKTKDAPQWPVALMGGHLGYAWHR